MILFRPVGRPPEVFDFNSTLMSQPLTSNPDALNSPKVYFIFVGPQWEQNGAPIAAVNSMIAAVKAILSSAYLSGLNQYGSDGNAVFGDFTIDTSLDPLTWTKDYILPNGTIDHSNNPVCGMKPTRSSQIRRFPLGIHLQEMHFLHRSTLCLGTREAPPVLTASDPGPPTPLALSTSSMSRLALWTI